MIRTVTISVCLCVAITGSLFAQIKYPTFFSSDTTGPTHQISNEYLPVVGVWVWGHDDLEPDGYKKSIDQLSKNSPFNLIVPFLRFHDKEVVDEEVYNQVKLAAEYAEKNNIGFLPDLDVRSARRAFQRRYPNEMQQMLRVQEIALTGDGPVEASITSIKDLNDHYSGGNIPSYNAIENELLRVYAYRYGSEGIDPSSITDITDQCQVSSVAADSMRVTIPELNGGQTHASAMAAFTLFYPDVFAPHLLDFQRDILEQYADVPLAGACKDEWGFPPYYPRFYEPGRYDFWYSTHMAEAYSDRAGGRELLSDCLLMAFPVEGREAERQAAINHFREMSLYRNTEIENDFYDAVKEIYGPDAAVTVHATWWPYPDFNEFKKNGLVWYAAKRDWAQTDELVPFAARTALCKKWGSPIWYNMYYTANVQDQVWGSALAGGRLNYLRYYSAFDEDIMRAENRIRLLNYISEAPLDCPVAVVFGHTAAMNWAGPYFDDVGMELVNKLWHAGYPTDLIPSTEIDNGSLKVDDDGRISYGSQKYSAVVVYHPEFEKNSTSEFFKKAAESPTALYRIGEWTRDFEGKPVASNLWPDNMTAAEDAKTAFDLVIKSLEDQEIASQSPATAVLDSSYFKLRGYEHTSYFPGREGFARMLDGLHVFTAATDQVSGDPINSTLKVGGFDVTVDAVGVVGVRLDDGGNPEALAVSDLKRFEAGDFTLQLEDRLDVVLWKENGEWEGVIQTKTERDIPEPLLEVTDKWTQLLLPVPPEAAAD